ncbi:hypothetical protein HHL26_00905 [Sphingobium sp. TB-6]|uniref:DUF4286 family protein n=1 Tax=Sphingobium sp. TB-6 TaxID=2728850 RepID=UPI00146CB383|nr:DUF4286 family protein [Sphingobium sp. TB-6]NML87629.1 hypothetical protein [Sphingobium sp. TB-6]
MARYRLIAFTDPVAGGDQDYNDWYNKVHLADVVAIPGFMSAQRFVLKAATAGEIRNRYVAIYDMETDDPMAVMAEVGRRAGTEQMFVSTALDAASENSGIFEPCSEIVYAPGHAPGLPG